MAKEINRNLMEQCRNGDISSFEKLFYLLKDDVYNVAFRVLGNHQDAEDITQEAFVKICHIAGSPKKVVKSIKAKLFNFGENIQYIVSLVFS